MVVSCALLYESALKLLQRLMAGEQFPNRLSTHRENERERLGAAAAAAATCHRRLAAVAAQCNRR
jgi:hypothetical protein